MPGSVDEIYELTAKKFGVPKQAVEHLIFDMWKFFRKEMSTQKGKDVLIPNWGSIYVNKPSLRYRIDKLKETIQKNEETFKSGGIEWFEYIEIWTSKTKSLVKYENMLATIEKRANRQPGERGL